MNDLIASTAAKLDHPLMLDWAVDYYCDLPKSANQARTAIEETWFHDIRLAQILASSDTLMIGELLRKLPKQRLAGLSHILANHWLSWPPSLAALVDEILSEIAPDEAFRVYSEAIASLERNTDDDLFKFGSADKVLYDAANPEHRELAERLAQGVLACPDTTVLSMLSPTLFKLSRLLAPETLVQLLDNALRPETGQKRLQVVFAALFTGLFGRDDYLFEVFDREQYDSEMTFAGSAPFFASDTPLARFDSWLEKLPEFDEVLQCLQPLAERSKACGTVLRLLKNIPSVSEIPDQAFKTRLALAACLHGYAITEFDTSALNASATMDLLALDMQDAHWLLPLTEHLKGFEAGEVETGLVERLRTGFDNFAAIHIADAMAELRYPGFAESLVDAMASDRGDFLQESAQKALTEIGGAAQAVLIERWDGLDQSQKIFGLPVIQNVGGPAAGDFAVTRFQALLADDMESACELFKRTPDMRLLSLLQNQLHRKQAFIDTAFYILARLFDKEGPEVDEAEQRAMADYRRSKDALKSLVSGHLPRADHLSLELKCPACGEINRYQAKGAVVGKDFSNGAAYLLADEFPCASCDADVEFKFTPMAQMAVSAELLKSPIDEHTALIGEPLVRNLEFRLDGKVLPLNQALSTVRARLELNQESAKDNLELGEMLYALNRRKAALNAYRKAAQFAPKAADARYALASLLASEGELDEAFDILRQTLEFQAKWIFLTSFPEFKFDFTELYNFLRRELNLTAFPSLHPSAISPPKKTGRNDPCPCGSGKKYKKCCGG